MGVGPSRRTSRSVNSSWFGLERSTWTDGTGYAAGFTDRRCRFEFLQVLLTSKVRILLSIY